jgi:hypothetical protein
MRITIEIDERTIASPNTTPEILTTIAPTGTSSQAAGTAQDGGPAPQLPGAAGVTTPSRLSGETAEITAGVSAGAAPTMGD